MTPRLLVVALLLSSVAHAVPRRAYSPPAPEAPSHLAPQVAPIDLAPLAAPVVTSPHMLPGSAFVASGPHADDLGGFGPSDNGPTSARGVAGHGDLFLHIDPHAAVRWRGHAGVRVRVVHGGDAPVTLRAQDSRIDLVQQVWVDETWRDLEHLPQSWCGNSRHRVTLAPGQAWVLDLPRYSGPIDADLRFVLRLYDREVASATFRGGVTPGQLAGERGSYSPTDLMDPTVGW